MRDGLVVREIEAQSTRLDHRTCLVDVRAQRVAQGFVQQVGGRVVAHSVPAHTLRHDSLYLDPRPQRALAYDAPMHYHPAHRPAGIAHFHAPTLPDERALVAYLP